MVQTPIRPAAPAPAHDPIVDKNARAYIKSIQEGKPIKPRPCADFGQWEQTITLIEKKYVFYKSKGDKERMNSLIPSFRELDPALDELLQPTVDEILAQVPPEPLFPPLPPSAYIDPRVSRGACPWLDDEYIPFSKKWSPRGYEGYHEAAGVSLMSTVAARRVSYRYIKHMEYTSLYIALMGFTTLFKKTTTVEIYTELLEAAGLDWMLGADETTPQKLLSNMAGKTVPSNYGKMTPDEQKWEQKRLAMAGQLGWFRDEFGQFMDSMMKENGPMADFKGLLRVLDDGKKTYRYNTHARGNEKIDNPYLSLLAAMTPADIRPHAGKNNKFWKDGLFARFCFVCPPEDAKSSRKDSTDDDPTYPASLVHPLQEWSEWLGMPEIEIESETNKNGDITGYTMRPISPLPERECFASADVKKHIKLYGDALLDIIESKQIHESLYGSYGRFHKVALRVAMLCASFENRGNIEMRHWARGQEFAEHRRVDLHELYRQVNTGNASEKTKFVEEIINELNRFKSLGIKGMTPAVLRAKSRTLQSYGSVTDLHEALVKMEKANVLVLHRTSHAPKGKYFLAGDEPQEEKEEKPKK